jgi:oligopeptide transport system ATP-binding protein
MSRDVPESAPSAPMLDVDGLKVQFRLPKRSLFSRHRVRRPSTASAFKMAHKGETLGRGGGERLRQDHDRAAPSCGLAPVDAPAACYSAGSGLGGPATGGNAAPALPPRCRWSSRTRCASLNPRMTVRSDHRRAARRSFEPRISRGGTAPALHRADGCTVGLLTRRFLNRYPHEFSGGQCQRIGIARAIDPATQLCSSATSRCRRWTSRSRAQMLEPARRSCATALRPVADLFISHDLSVVRHLCHRGSWCCTSAGMMEMAPAKHALQPTPATPIPRALLSAVPLPDPVVEESRERILLPGDPPSPDRDPVGCAFAMRCPIATDKCRVETPMLEGASHQVACWERSVD